MDNPHHFVCLRNISATKSYCVNLLSLFSPLFHVLHRSADYCKIEKYHETDFSFSIFKGNATVKKITHCS